jgi:catechol 2,3-dioxygenase-like lactoylglutathione lyase family enzyme
MIRTRGLRHIHLLVRSKDASLRFYQAVFGCKELFREDELVFIRTPGTDDLITLHEDPGAKDVGTSGGVRHFGFELVDVADMDAAVRAVEVAGGRLIRRGEHDGGTVFAYVEDPDGYIVELDARATYSEG